MNNLEDYLLQEGKFIERLIEIMKEKNIKLKVVVDIRGFLRRTLKLECLIDNLKIIIDYKYDIGEQNSEYDLRCFKNDNNLIFNIACKMSKNVVISGNREIARLITEEI